MASFRAQFENELREKLQQKSTSHTSDETVLLRSFKYFDLDNSGCVSFSEFQKAIEKIGVVINDYSQLRGLYDYYDTDRSSSLDYKEFTAMLFGDKPAGRSPQKATAQLQEGERAIEKLRQRLAARGGRGILGLARQFKIMDDDNSKCLDMYEFSKAIRDFRVDISDAEIQACFDYVDRNRSGTVDYDEFLRAVRGPMNSFRQNLVSQAFRKLDRDGSGVIDINDVRGVYNARGHPDVRSGKKTEEDVLGEFLETFEFHHNITGTRDRSVTTQEFMEYYNNISCSIDNDQYFELMMNNTWKLTEAPAYTRNKAWANESPTGSRPLAKAAPERPATESRPSYPRGIEGLFQKFRSRLASRGARGIIGIQRQFKIIDDDNSKNISVSEFKKCCKDFRIDISDAEVEQLFGALDRDRSGTVDYDELIRGIRGPMNAFRTQLVDQAWKKMDRDGSGVLDINDIRGVYSAKNHPDVRAGKKTEDEVLGDFLETFETHHNISDLSRRDQRVSREEFQEYYNNVSASVDDDRYFELMMNNAWNLKGEAPAKQAWSSDYSPNFTRGQKRAYPAASAPFGVSQEPVDYTTSSRQRPEPTRTSQEQRPAGTSTWGVKPQNSEGGAALLVQLRNKLAGRGARGFVGMARQFKIMDDNNSKCLDFYEFSKALRDFRVEMSQEDAQKLFNYMDADRSGEIQYEEFIHRLRGQLNDFRKQIIGRAFQKLDKNGNGIVELDDVKGVYNAKGHPDVRSGKKTEDDILCEFLDTFEAHHATYKQDTRDHRITMDEFLEYYSHVSASIDDDRYFELMMNNSWNFEGKTYQKGWGGDYTSPARRQR